MREMKHAKKESFNVFDGLLIGTLIVLAFLAAIQAGISMRPDAIEPGEERMETFRAEVGAPASVSGLSGESAVQPEQKDSLPGREVVMVCESPTPPLSAMDKQEAAKSGKASESKPSGTAVKTSFSARKDIPLSPEFQEYVVKKCEKEKIDSNLVYAIMWHETRFQSDLISETDDYGLMQINRQAHFSELQRRYGITDMKQMLEPYRNAEYGIELIASLVNRYGVEKGLAAYKCGEAGMKANLRRGYMPVDVADMVAKAGEYRAAEEGRA